MAAESMDIALEDAELLASMENDETLQSAEVRNCGVLSCNHHVLHSSPLLGTFKGLASGLR